MNSRRTAVVVSLSVLLLVSACSEGIRDTSTSSTTSSTLPPQFPGPEKTTCDLAEEAQLILEEATRAGVTFLDDESRTEGRERADDLYKIAKTAEVFVVFWGDAWARQLMDAANDLGLLIDRIVAGRTVSDPENFGGASERFEAVLSRCDTTQ